MNIGIYGTGTIASWTSSMVGQLNRDDICLYACATAPGFDCTEFAEKYGWKKIHASFEELIEDKNVDLVYIAVPNVFHYDLCKKALDAGKAVVVEKPFAMTVEETEELMKMAKEKGLFLNEALWPEFLPMRGYIDDEIAAGTIGELTGGKIIALDNVMFLDRVKNAGLGGGFLLDNGAYTLGFMTSHFGTDIKSVSSKVRKLDTGVDAESELDVCYNNGIHVYIRQVMDYEGEHYELAEIYGTKGTITAGSIANIKTCRVLDLDGNVVKELTAPPQIKNQGMPPVSGYEHEFIAFEKAIREGKLECDEAPHSQSIAISRIITDVRREHNIIS